MTLPETGTVSYTYNSSSGLLATKTDAKGTRKEYTYDTKQRVTQVKYFNGSTEIANTAVTYSYDTNPYDAAYTQYGNGRPTAVQYPIQVRCPGWATGICY